MAKQPMRPEVSLKSMESFDTFNGGMNTVADQTNLGDNEVRLLVNRDIGERGSLKRRHGLTHHVRKPIWSDLKGKTWGDLNGG